MAILGYVVEICIGLFLAWVFWNMFWDWRGR